MDMMRNVKLLNGRVVESEEFQLFCPNIKAVGAILRHDRKCD